MKKAIFCLAPLCAVALFAQGPRGGFGGGGFGGRGFGFGGGGSRTPVTGAPYSATRTLTTQQTLANGNQISQTHTASVARDTYGRTSVSEAITPPASSGKAPFTKETIVDPVAGYLYELNSATMIAIQTPLPKPRTGAPPSTPPGQPNAPQEARIVNLGTQAVNNVPATGTQITETIPAGAIGNAQPIQISRTTWVSTTLNIPVERITSDPRFGNTDLELTNISTAEPTIGVPSGYTIQPGRRGPGGPAGAARRGPRTTPRQPAQ